MENLRLVLFPKATSDLSTIDKKRREEFKAYEIEKEGIRREKLKGMDEKKRHEEEKAFEELQKKHKDHPKLHHPVGINFYFFQFYTFPNL